MARFNDRLQEHQIQSALRDARGPAAVIREDLVIIGANQAYQALFAHADREIIGRRCYAVNHGNSRPCDSSGEICPIALSRTRQGEAEAVHTHYTSNGKNFENVRIRPLEDGRVDAFMVILAPASERGQARCPFVGKGPSFRRMMTLIERVAPSDIPVLLTGESGTGKELVASEIHRKSNRSRGPFVPVDCSGLAETLFESELFGHEKGAFTGATQARKGLVESASGGTLFLDEIGDVPLPQQVKLLRLLETCLYRRVGSVELRKSDFRLICATHRDLRVMVDNGQFRRDLFHRINAFPIQMPPLRERPEDLELIATDLLSRICQNGTARLSTDAVQRLKRCSFPGNVRQLLNILQRACVLSDDGVIELEHLPDDLELPASGGRQGDVEVYPPEEIVPIDEMHRRYLRWAVGSFEGERRELAHRLGISERSLYRRLSFL